MQNSIMLRNGQNGYFNKLLLINSFSIVKEHIVFLMTQYSKNIDLLLSEQSIFQPLTPQIEWEIQKQELVICSQFNVFSQICQVYLYPKFIKLKLQPATKVVDCISLYLKLDSSVKVGLIYQKVDNPFAKKIGISVFKDQEMPYNFYTEDSDIPDIWVNELSKVVFLSGFLNQYKPLSYIGRGQFAKVWEVERKFDGTKFAAKCVDNDECFGQVNGQQALYNEIQILRKLDHPNIMHIESVYESQKTTYMILQFLKGETFSQFVRKMKESSSQSQNSLKSQKQHAHRIMKNLLKAVCYLHSTGIAHRDLKPGNIIIDSQSCEPFIIDFGLSQQIDKSRYLFERCGSPGYMAPQIFSEQQGVQDLKKCDVFSLGALFYLLLTGEPLFIGNCSEDIIRQTNVFKGNFKKKIYSKLKGNEAQLLISMLHHNPQKRVSAEEALESDYFIDQMYDHLKQIRKPLTSASDSSKCSLRVKGKESRFQQLFSESIIALESKYHPQFDEIIGQSIRSSTNIVTPSQKYHSKIKSRVKRCMSQESIETDLPLLQQGDKKSWSGKWKNFTTLERLLRKGHLWSVKSTNFIFRQ